MLKTKEDMYEHIGRLIEEMKNRQLVARWSDADLTLAVNMPGWRQSDIKISASPYEFAIDRGEDFGYTIFRGRLIEDQMYIREWSVADGILAIKFGWIAMPEGYRMKEIIPAAYPVKSIFARDGL